MPEGAESLTDPRVRARLRTKAIRVTTSASAGWTAREVEFARAIIALLDYIERDLPPGE